MWFKPSYWSIQLRYPSSIAGSRSKRRSRLENLRWAKANVFPSSVGFSANGSLTISRWSGQNSTFDRKCCSQSLPWTVIAGTSVLNVSSFMTFPAMDAGTRRLTAPDTIHPREVSCRVGWSSPKSISPGLINREYSLAPRSNLCFRVDRTPDPPTLPCSEYEVLHLWIATVSFSSVVVR